MSSSMGLSVNTTYLPSPHQSCADHKRVLKVDIEGVGICSSH